ncbi:MAG: GAF domain-containing sensor histidine kinase [Actinomycetota bacterium]
MDAMTSIDGVDAALGRLAWLALRETEAERCAIFVAGARGDLVLHPRAGASSAGDLAELWARFRGMGPLHLTGPLQRHIERHGGIAFAIEDGTSSELLPDDWRRVWKPTSLALAPMRADGDLLGLLVVDHIGLSRPFGREHVKLLEAIATAAGTALRGAILVEQLQTRVRLAESLHRVSDAVLGTSDLKAALATINRDVGAGIGAECVRLGFADPALAELLRVPKATDDERAIIAAWRRTSKPAAVWSGLEGRFPVAMGRRAAGVLSVRARHELDASALEVVQAIAAGLGEVTLKAKLRRTADRRAQELAVAADRERIARDLHDTVGQTLYGIGLKLQDVLTEVDDPELSAKLQEVRESAAIGVADVRSAVYALSVLHMRERGLVPSLRSLTRRFSLATGVGTELRVPERLPTLDEDVAGGLYRVAHEALVNVERHARATGVVVSLVVRDDHLELVIRDDGVGISRRDGAGWQSSAHFGLRSMARSMEEIGGRFDVVRARPRGIVIRARAPVRMDHRGITV